MLGGGTKNPSDGLPPINDCVGVGACNEQEHVNEQEHALGPSGNTPIVESAEITVKHRQGVHDAHPTHVFSRVMPGL